jgi:hypothetical protein
MYALQGKIRPTCHTHPTLSSRMVSYHTCLMWSTYTNLLHSPHEVKTGPYTQKKSWQPKTDWPSHHLGSAHSSSLILHPSGYTSTSAYLAHIAACDRYVQYLVTGANPSVWTYTGGDYNLEGASFSHLTPRPFQWTILHLTLVDHQYLPDLLPWISDSSSTRSTSIIC